MEPRLVIKTHGGVSNPGIFSILIDRCSYADKSSAPEVVARRLFEIFKADGRDFKLASKFAVFMARRFSFVQQNMTWDWRGLVIEAVLRHVGKSGSDRVAPFLELVRVEQIIYLKYYLESDGALILLLAKDLNKRGELEVQELGKRIHELFREIYEGYLDLCPDFRTRRQLRERLKKVQSGVYKQTEVHHKILAHLDPLCSLGVLKRKGEDRAAFSSIELGAQTTTTKVIESELVDFRRMEDRFSQGEIFGIVAKVLGIAGLQNYVETNERTLVAKIFQGYEYLKDGITGTASVEALSDWTSAILLAEEKILLEREKVGSFLELVWKKKPGAVRYHVDFKGERSYVILTEMFQKEIT